MDADLRQEAKDEAEARAKAAADDSKDHSRRSSRPAAKSAADSLADSSAAVADAHADANAAAADTNDADAFTIESSLALRKISRDIQQLVANVANVERTQQVAVSTAVNFGQDEEDDVEDEHWSNFLQTRSLLQCIFSPTPLTMRAVCTHAYSHSEIWLASLNRFAFFAATVTACK